MIDTYNVRMPNVPQMGDFPCDFGVVADFRNGDTFRREDRFMDCIDLSADESRYDLFPHLSEFEECGRTDGNIHVMSERGQTSGRTSGLVMTDYLDITDDSDLSTDGPTQRGHPTHDVRYDGHVYNITPELVYKQDADGDTLLHTAIIFKKTSLAIECIGYATSPDMLSIKNKLHQTPLHLAVLTNQPEIAQRLLTGGADVNSRDKHGYSPLILACKHNYIEVVQTLLQPLQANEHVFSSPHFATPYRITHPDLNLRNYEGLSAVHVAASHGYESLVDLLIHNGADVNAIDGKTGRTVLHNACISGDVTLVRRLLTVDGCDVNARTFDDYTPFDLARIRHHNEIQILLAKFGSGTDISDQ